MNERTGRKPSAVLVPVGMVAIVMVAAVMVAVAMHSDPPPSAVPGSPAPRPFLDPDGAPRGVLPPRPEGAFIDLRRPPPRAGRD